MTKDYSNYLENNPSAEGNFGEYGGAYLPPQLVGPMNDIHAAYLKISRSADFINELREIRKHFQGRPTPTYHAKRISEQCGGAEIYLKREDLNHTGAHKLNHCMGEGLLAKYMGKKKLIAETGAGQHGVALATAAAYFGLECEIHMGEVDIAKEHPNVIRMKLLGAKVVPVSFGLKTLKEAVDSAFGAYLEDPETSIYCIGSVVGPHPFPMMVRDFQRVVGIESREQFQEMTGGLPDLVTACVGGGSNAMGLFSAFLNDPCEIWGVEPMGRGPGTGELHSDRGDSGRRLADRGFVERLRRDHGFEGLLGASKLFGCHVNRRTHDRLRGRLDGQVLQSVRHLARSRLRYQVGQVT